MKIEAYSLQEAYIKASNELDCSAADINIQIITKPSAGFLGLFKKLGVFEATLAKSEQKQNKNDKHKKNKEIKADKTHAKKQNEQSTLKQAKHTKADTQNIKAEHKEEQQEQILTQNNEQNDIKQNETQSPKNTTPSAFVAYNDIIDNFNANSEQKISANEEIAKSVQADLARLFAASDFKINEPQVSVYDENTLFIKLDGEDCALLIGKEGYRYKALSYLLYNWINAKYDLNIRFEVAEFLSNQENAVAAYLAGVIERVREQGFGSTKPLDGVLLKIALEQLRKEFPNKYVGIKSSDEGRYIIVSDLYKK